MNKEISNYTATYVDEQTLSFNITFARPADISTDLNDLDYLEIEFLMLEWIIDAESFEYLAPSKRKKEVRVVP